jgi:hypothetical protein
MDGVISCRDQAGFRLTLPVLTESDGGEEPIANADTPRCFSECAAFANVVFWTFSRATISEISIRFAIERSQKSEVTDTVPFADCLRIRE